MRDLSFYVYETMAKARNAAEALVFLDS